MKQATFKQEQLLLFNQYKIQSCVQQRERLLNIDKIIVNQCSEFCHVLVIILTEKIEDTKGVTRSSKSKKYR